MIKQIYITNGAGTSGKDSFSKMLNKYISTYKYSIVELSKQAAKVLGWDGTSKTAKDRRFLSDIMDLATEYNDSPFRDVVSIIADFKNNLIEDEILIIDMRDPKDITRTVKMFEAKTILIRNPRVEKIETNHADANVENYDYDYIIENNGTLEQLDATTREFVEFIISEEESLPLCAYCTFGGGKRTVVFQCNKMLR